MQQAGRATSLRTQIVVPPILSNADQNSFFLRRESSHARGLLLLFSLVSVKTRMSGL